MLVRIVCIQHIHPLSRFLFLLGIPSVPTISSLFSYTLAFVPLITAFSSVFLKHSSIFFQSFPHFTFVVFIILGTYIERKAYFISYIFVFHPHYPCTLPSLFSYNVLYSFRHENCTFFSTSSSTSFSHLAILLYI